MSSVAAKEETVVRKGIVIRKSPVRERESPRFRTYEVYQRERVGESTEKIKPIQLISDEYQLAPYPLLGILRENYPCYREWLSNSFWITRDTAATASQVLAATGGLPGVNVSIPLVEIA